MDDLHTTGRSRWRTDADGAMVTADPRLGVYVDAEDTVLKAVAVSAARLSGDRLEDGRVIWRQSPAVIGLGHFGGRLLFLPDGTLVVASGDRQSFEPAQDRASSLGKILRITRDGGVPPDNPFAAAPAPLDAVWSLGHRNPLGMAVRPETGRLYVHEMGPLYGDELNAPAPGANHGWPTVSNGENYDLSDLPHHETRPGDFAAPLYYWRPAISPSGFAFYQGSLFPEWRGDALIGSLSERALVRLAFEGDLVSDHEIIPLGVRVRDVTTAADGAVLILTDHEDGALLRLTPAE